ncbi:hypothetical protein L963_1539 [Leuconostoc mesenteroides subsp. cremoris T26]|nr:hypothetical protein L963_1539 [Leuconostoc mesenteroides subsp. cremoris T26]
MIAFAEQRRVDRTHRCERLDAALRGTGREQRRILFGIEQCDARLQSVLARDLQRDVAHPVQRHIAAGGAAGADEQWDLRPGLGFHQDQQIGLDRGSRILGPAGGEIGRPAVGGAGIAGDGVRAGGHAGGHVGLRQAEAERADGDQHVGGGVEALWHGKEREGLTRHRCSASELL